MRRRIIVLGAGFGGLELSTTLSEALGDSVDITLIDKADAFVFGYAKLDVMIGREPPAAVRHPYKEFVKPGVRMLRETVTAIDPAARRVTTDAGTHDAAFVMSRSAPTTTPRPRPGSSSGERVLLDGRRRAAARGATQVQAR
jgi:sulfide:quinone oxidoreductase